MRRKDSFVLKKKQLYRWSCNRFDKPFGKTVPRLELLKTCSHITPCRAHQDVVNPGKATIFGSISPQFFVGAQPRLAQNSSKRLLKPVKKPCQPSLSWFTWKTVHTIKPLKSVEQLVTKLVKRPVPMHFKLDCLLCLPPLPLPLFIQYNTTQCRSIGGVCVLQVLHCIP
jgi:hypothetical protein